MRPVKISLRSVGGYHIVKIGKGNWVFDTFLEALEYVATERHYEFK